jgi:3-hydroxybutyrate dehydrogenase
MRPLAGKSALITGSVRGLGLAAAHRFAAAGCNLVLSGFDDGRDIAALRREIEERHGIRTIYDAADLRRQHEIDRMVSAGLDAFGSIDIVVNNAVVRHTAPIESFGVSAWDDGIAVNLSAAFHTIRLTVPGMKQRGWGRIITTASAHSLVASPFKSAYVAAKHGIAGLTKTVALELARSKITCNCISPGYVWTPLVEKQIPNTMKARNMDRDQVINDVLLAAQPTKEFVTVEQVASLALFLCSEDAAQITGANFSIDGGWTAA